MDLNVCANVQFIMDKLYNYSYGGNTRRYAMNGTFYEQLGVITGVFESWGTCERTVVLCALARRVPWSSLKLLQRAVEAAIERQAPAPGEGERLEREANDEATIAAVACGDFARVDEDKNCERLRQLLIYLPLLRADNDRAKDVYVAAVPTLVQCCVDSLQCQRQPADLCRQLLSYLLVHPALTHHDRRSLTQWLQYLENYISGNINTDVWQQRMDMSNMTSTNIWGSCNSFRRTIGKNVEFRGIIDTVVDSNIYSSELLQESFSKNGRDVDISIEGDKINFDVTISQPKSHRSNSLTPPSSNFMHMSSSAENLSDEPFVQKPRSFSLSSEHSLGQLRPIGITYATTGSDTRLDDLRSNNFGEQHPGMSMVAHWLKSLRLHKYVWLFSNISYDQMMTMDEEYLEKLGVTKGARHKLLLSIKKLNERQALLENMERELRAGPPPQVVGRLLESLRTVLVSPIAVGSPLPATIVRVLELASKALLMAPGGITSGSSSGAPRLVLPSYQQQFTIEDGGAGAGTCEQHDNVAIDPVSLHCWLVEKALHHESFTGPELVDALKRMRYRLPPRQFFHYVSDMPLNRRCPKPRWRMNGSAQGTQLKGGVAKRSWMPPSRTHSSDSGSAAPGPRGKSNSYPPFPPYARPRPLQFQPPVPAPISTLGDIDSSLDALCLQMTEQAIN